jgi:hypothetical protein
LLSSSDKRWWSSTNAIRFMSMRLRTGMKRACHYKPRRVVNYKN